MLKKYTLRVLALSMAAVLLLTSSGAALTLRYGQKGDDVAQLQAALKQLGYYTKTIDGAYGAGTRSAVRLFQRANSLTVDGVAGPKTLEKLETLTGIEVGGSTSSGGSTGDSSGDSSSTAGTGLFGGVYTTIEYSNKGDRVRILQQALKALGFTVTVDGNFGSGTYTAVRAFQQSQGLTVDGKAGKNTLKKLETFFDEDGNLISSPVVTDPPAEDEEEIAYDVPSRTLRYGMSGLDVAYTQQRLYTLNYYTGARDGNFGTGMLSAVKAFQQRNGLTVDGVVGAGTIGVLFSSSAIAAEDEEAEEEEAFRTLYLGMSGDDVAAVQLRLKDLGYFTGMANGEYDSATAAAVRAFQNRNSLTADGVVGEATAARLYSSSAIAAETTDSETEEATPAPTTTLKYGDKGDEVKALQRRLQELGYYTSTVDGIYGSGTYNAVKSFQKHNGLTVDGKAGSNTLARLYAEDAVGAKDEGTEETTPTPTPTPTPTATPSRTLRYGYSGDDVVLLQTRLIELGYLNATADGTFGSSTLKAVKAFQQQNGLTVDGVAGTNTYRKLFSDSAVAAPEDSDDTAVIPDRSLTYGDEGDDVKSVQQRLKALGYLIGTVDGVYGTSATAAMKAFQQMNSLTATGDGNLATYARLYSDDAITATGVKEGESASSYINLRSGATGTLVIRLQQALASYDYDVSVTGTYDDATVQAVRSFQVINGLSVDGVAGKNTQSLLYSGSAKAFPTGPDGAVYGSMGYVAAPAKSQIKLLHWQDDIKDNVAYGDALLAYDPETGISWSLTIIARGRHCDVEPSTKADTAAMMQAFGNKVYWTPVKPVYVRLPDGRWTVATTHNVAHGINPIPDNDFEGQNCVHFLRDMSEAEQNDPNYGVTNQEALRDFWKSLTGQTIAYK